MKKVSKIKRFLSLVLIFLFSINSFAAIVSDNDGSAFITKAEFDALKSSFAEQIDNYNASIDGKIDGAIASYLSGLNRSSVTEYAQLCYSSDGILSPRAGYKDLNFKMGTLKWDFVWFPYSSGCQGKYVETGKTPVDFNELGINDIYNNGTKYVASWTGFITDKQQLVQTGFHQGSSTEYFDMMANSQKWQTNALGMRQINDIRLNTYTTELKMLCLSMSWASANPWGTWTFQSIHNTATRTLSLTKNQNIIITPQSVSCKRFSRLDDVYDWSNCVDPDTTTFKKLTDGNSTSNLGEYLGSFKAEVCCGYGQTAKTNLSGSFVKGKSGTAGNNVYYWNGSSASASKPSGWDTNNSWLPYFGFCNYYTDYNQLYVKKYDNYISSMSKYQPTLNIISDADGTKHLALNAGAPIVEAEKDQEVIIPIKFADTSKDYDVWFKIGSFDYDKDPDSETDLLTATSIKINGATASPGLASNSYKIPSGNANVNIVMPESGYIFMKWQYADTSVVGGGTYMPESKITVITYDN